MHNLPRVTVRAKRAWSLLRRRKAFYLRLPNGKVALVDRGGWCHLQSGSVRAETLLDPAKKG